MVPMRLSEFVDEKHGRQTEIARAIGVDPQLVWQWAREARPIPAGRRPEIERATDGVVTCEEQGDEITWLRVPDAAWPWHPKGKPLRDMVAEPSGEAAKA